MRTPAARRIDRSGDLDARRCVDVCAVAMTRKRSSAAPPAPPDATGPCTSTRDAAGVAERRAADRLRAPPGRSRGRCCAVRASLRRRRGATLTSNSWPAVACGGAAHSSDVDRPCRRRRCGRSAAAAGAGDAAPGASDSRARGGRPEPQRRRAGKPSVPDGDLRRHALRAHQVAHDARRDQQHDLGLGALVAVVREQARRASECRRGRACLGRRTAVLVADQAGQHLGLAVLQAQRGGGVARAEPVGDRCRPTR